MGLGQAPEPTGFLAGLGDLVGTGGDPRQPGRPGLPISYCPGWASGRLSHEQRVHDDTNRCREKSYTIGNQTEPVLVTVPLWPRPNTSPASKCLLPI